MGLATDLSNNRRITLDTNGGLVVQPMVGVGPQGPAGLPGSGSPAWVAAEAVTTSTVRQAPDGSFIKSTASRTTRSTFDSTEQGFWTATLATAGTIENSALLASITGIALLTNVAVSADGALARQKLTKVDASGGVRAMTIPDGTQVGEPLAVEKTDSSANLVNVTGKIRSTGSTTLPLTYQYETIQLVWGGTFWEPLAGHRTKTSVDTQIDARSRTGKRPVGQGELAICVDDYLAGSGAAAETAAWVAAIAAAVARARSSAGGLYQGLPRIYASGREWRINSSLALKSIYGLTIEGDASATTILRVDSGIDVLEIQRAQNLTFRNLTLACGTAGSASTDGLIENSGGVWVHEDSTDSGIPGSTTQLLFQNVRFAGFHRAIHVNGNQACDNVSFENCRWTDNFYDFDMSNGQAVNWRTRGGEVISWENDTEVNYNKRLALWSSASYPVSAKSGQYQDPALSSGTTQNVTCRDGAAIRSMAGGEFYCDARFSIIARKTHLLFGQLPASPQAVYGTTSQSLGFIFDGVTGELRATDAVLDSNGCQRITLCRFEVPFAGTTPLARCAPTVQWKKCRYTVNAASMDVVHLAGPTTMRWHDVRLTGSSGVGNLKLCTVSGSVTYNQPGSFDGQGSTLLTPVMLTKDSTGVSAADPTIGTHDVRQRGATFGTGMAYQSTTPPAQRSRIRNNNRPIEPVISQFSGTDGTVLGSPPNPAGNLRYFNVGIGAVIRRVGIVLSSVMSGTPGDIVLRFRNSANTLTYVDLTAKWATTASATESIGPYGKIFDAHRRPWAEINDFAPADGLLVCEVITSTTAYLAGFAWVEFY